MQMEFHQSKLKIVYEFLKFVADVMKIFLL